MKETYKLNIETTKAMRSEIFDYLLYLLDR
jgi:hypothetical protein